MSDGIQIKTTGFKELDELFAKLKDSQKQSAWRSALRVSAKPIVESAKQNVLSRTKSKSKKLYKSIGVRPINRQSGIQIGARTAGKFKGHIGNILESGTKIRATRGGGKKRRGATRSAPLKSANRGKVKATHWFSDAVRDNEKIVNDSISNNFTNSVIKMVERYNRKASAKR